MTAVTEETPIAFSNANGVTTSFPHNFTVLATGDLVVTGLAPGESSPTTYVFGDDYTITGVGANAGSVEFVSPPANGTLVTRYRSSILERTTDYQNNGDFLADTVNLDINRVWLVLQEILLGTRGPASAVRAPAGESLNALPVAAARASRLIGLDSTGQTTTYPLGSGNSTSAADSSFLQAGTGAVGRTVEDKLREHKSLTDYSSTAVAIAAAVAGDFVIDVLDDLTVNIPADAATLQICVDRLTPLNKQATITLNIASGHALTAGLSIAARDCGQFRITSDDAEVSLAASFSANVLSGTNGSFLPRLACLINAANQASGNGVNLSGNSSIRVEANCGIKNVWGTGLMLFGGCFAHAEDSIWTGAARNAATGAGITAWSSICHAEGADVSDSDYYGAQAAHGGLLSFRHGVANNCFRHGIRATDAAIVDADGATANDCSADGAGYSVYAYQAGVVNFVDGSATGNLGTAALLAFGAGSAINAEGATVTGASEVNVFVRRGGRINVVDATVSGAGDADFMNQGGEIFRFENQISGAPVPPSSVTISSGDIRFVPDPSRITYMRVATEGGAASDNLDTITPATGFSISAGHIVILTTVSSSNDVVSRDFSVSAAAGDYSLRTEAAASITLADSSQVVAFMWLGSFWVQLLYSAN